MDAPHDIRPATSLPGDADRVIVPVIAERVRVGGQWRATGCATRVRKVVRERDCEIDVPTWREEIHVERVPIGRPVDVPVAVRHEGDVLVIPVVEERLVLRTECILREEVRITRRRHARNERRTVTLRHEVAIVERYDPATETWSEIDVPSGAAHAVPDCDGSPEGEASEETPASETRSSTTKPRTSPMFTVIGAFDDRQSAQRTVDTLVLHGIPRESIDLQSRSAISVPVGTTVSSGTASGVHAVRHEDDEGFFAGVRQFFASLFGGDDEATAGVYSEAIRRGGTIVTVDARDEAEAERAAGLMREQGGTIDLDERRRSWSETGTGHAATGGTAGAMAAQALSDPDRIAPTAVGNEQRLRGADAEVVMPVVQEDVKVGKRAVEQGGVRVVRRVTETPVSELVRLREERARIERRPVDREATSADLENFREGSIEIRERTEEPVIEKTARVVEEVVVGREVNERTERVEETARRTDVEIDRLSRQADERLQRETGDTYDEGLPGTAAVPDKTRRGTRNRDESLRRKS